MIRCITHSTYVYKYGVAGNSAQDKQKRLPSIGRLYSLLFVFIIVFIIVYVICMTLQVWNKH